MRSTSPRGERRLTLALAAPIRSTAPRASRVSAPPSRSYRRYLKLVLPRLATRIFMSASRPPAERADDRVARPRDHVRGLQLADPPRRLRPRLDRGADAAHVAPDHDADEPAVELDHRAGELDARRLEHRVDRIDQPDQTLRLDQAKSVAVHRNGLIVKEIRDLATD